MAGLDAYTFISTFFANSYLCIRVPITGSQKSYFSHLHGCVEWFSGMERTPCGPQAEVVGRAHKKVIFLPTT
jgi:sarcosine oxidase delta subunit